MDALLPLLLLWAGFLGTCIALRLGMNAVESHLDSSLGPLAPVSRRRIQPLPCTPERVSDVIGQYRGAPIYARVVVARVAYRYDRVQPEDAVTGLCEDEILLSPGLVYRPLNALFAH